jgi:DNA polymerase elongation subunit (family B)
MNIEEILNLDIKTISTEDLQKLLEKVEAEADKESYAMAYTYNIIDIVRVEELEHELKFIELIFSLSHFTRTNLHDAFATVKPCDVVIHNKMMDYKVVIPHKKAESSELSRIIAGGYVKEVIPGLYPYVMSYDFTSLYPHIIMTYNISPDAYMGKLDKFDNVDNPDRIINDRVYDEIKEKLLENNMCITAKGTVFSRAKKSFFAEIMEEVFAKRKEYKDIMLLEEQKLEEIKKKLSTNPDDAKLKEEYKKTKSRVVEFNNQQLATKIFANAFYGGLANPYSRWFSYDIAESITLSGQLASKYVEKYANIYLNKMLKTDNVDYIIAVDTDSAYFNMEGVVKKAFPNGGEREEIVKFLSNFSKHLEEHVIQAAMEDLYSVTNAYQKKLHMKLEVIAQVIWRKSKNYVMGVFFNEGVFYSEMKIKMKGIEAVKSSTPEVCRNYIKNSIPIILNNDKDGLLSFIEKCREEFYSLPFEKVANPGGVNGVSKYSDINTLYTKGTPLHVRGSLLYNKLLEDHDLDKTYMKIQSGDKIKFTYLKLPNPIREDVISSLDELPEEFGLDQFIDYDRQFEKTFIKPITSLANPAGISLENKSDMSQFYE